MQNYQSTVVSLCNDFLLQAYDGGKERKSGTQLASLCLADAVIALTGRTSERASLPQAAVVVIALTG